MKLYQAITSFFARRTARRVALATLGWAPDDTFPDVGDWVELIETGRQLGQCTRRRGKVVELKAWTPHGADRAHAYALVDLPNGKNWFPLDGFARERGIHVQYHS